MKSILLIIVSSFMFWMLVGCNGFLDEYRGTADRSN